MFGSTRGINAIAFHAGLLLAVLGGGCAEKPAEPLRIALSPWPGYEPLYYAREKGYLPATEVKLVDYTSQTGVARAFQNGAVQAATLTLDSIIKLRKSGIDIAVVLVMDVSSGADVLLAKPGIKTLKDLKGKRIGVETTALGDYMLARALEKADMKPSDVHVVPLEVVEQARAFSNDVVDAVITYEPVRGKLLAAGARSLFDSSQIPGEIVDVLVVRNEFLQNGERQVMSLLRGWFKAVDDMRSSDAAIRFMAQRERVSEQDFTTSLNGLLISDLQENQAQLLGTPPALLAPVLRLARMMREKGLIDGDVEVSRLCDGRYVGRVTQ